MQLCESCGACRETDWRLCPFCRATLSTADAPLTGDSERFDALAAAAETSELDVLPSLIADDEDDPEPDTDLLTAQDLAHLTGDGGPSVNGWESPTPPAPAPIESNDAIDAPVSKAVVFPLVAVALAAVAFVAYSILTAPPPDRPDTVALIDRTTTTIISPTTTEARRDGPGAIGVDLAEQAEWLCAGDQFSIARAEAPSLAIYNDLLTVTKDGRGDWTAPADHVTLRGPVPSLIGCLTTADGGEIDRCPSDGPIISRRSVVWTYRVVQSIDGTTLGSDQGTASELRSCDTLIAEASGQDSASWSPLPQDLLNQVAAASAGAPHPQAACPTSPDDVRTVTEPISFEQGASLHATVDGITDTDVTLPAGWMATEERPVDVVLCLEDLGSTSDPSSDTSAADKPVPPTTLEACRETVRVHAMHRDGRVVGSWDYVSKTCAETGEEVTPPDSWWISTIGPALGYEVEPSETEGS